VTPAVDTWAAAQKVSGSRFVATGGDATYTFVVTWPGDARTEPYRSVCGEKSETITVVTGKPAFITQLVAPPDADTSTVDTAQAQQTGITIKPGQDLVDVLHIWNQDTSLTPAPMNNWQVTWQVYFVPANSKAPADSKIVSDLSGAKVYSNVACTSDTLFWTADQPVAVEAAGAFASPVFTARPTRLPVPG